MKNHAKDIEFLIKKTSEAENALLVKQNKHLYSHLKNFINLKRELTKIDKN